MGVVIDSFLITCEHGGNRIPAPYLRLFRGRERCSIPIAGTIPVRLRWRGRSPGPSGRRSWPQPSAARDRPQSLAWPSAAVLGGDARRAGGGARRDRRAMLRPVSGAGGASRRASGVARPARDSHFVAQLSLRCWKARCGAPTWVCSITPQGPRKSGCALAGRQRSRHWRRNSGCAAITLRWQRRRADLVPASALRAGRVPRH